MLLLGVCVTLRIDAAGDQWSASGIMKQGGFAYEHSQRKNAAA
jgi:hypothetical protein